MNNKTCQYSPLEESLIRHSSCKVYVREWKFMLCVPVCESVRFFCVFDESDDSLGVCECVCLCWIGET